jgi:hypothetical protein
VLNKGYLKIKNKNGFYVNGEFFLEYPCPWRGAGSQWFSLMVKLQFSSVLHWKILSYKVLPL